MSKEFFELKYIVCVCVCVCKDKRITRNAIEHSRVEKVNCTSPYTLIYT